MKNYKKIIAQKLEEQKEKVVSPQNTSFLGMGDFLIRVELPVKYLHRFKDEYKQLSHMGNFESWNFDLDKYISVVNNKWDIEYRLYFDATPEKLEYLKHKYGNRIRESKFKAYPYQIDDNDLIRNMIKNGAHLGLNKM